MSKKAPDFENAAKCFKCDVVFGLITRKHHCRNCGHTFCNNCSAKTAPLPHFGFNEPTRVCDNCYRAVSSGSTGAANRVPSSSAPRASSPPPATPPTSTSPPPSSSSSSSSAASQVPNAGMPAAKPVETKKEEKKVKNCRCNVPLCICLPDPEEKKDEKKAAPAAAPVASPAPKPSAPVQQSQAKQTQFFSSFSGFGSRTEGSYDMRGDLNEQCREAIKANDINGFHALMKAGASITYKDRTGYTLLHIAVMFNRQDMVAYLIKAGADINAKNTKNETPLDLAAPALALKMTQKQF